MARDYKGTGKKAEKQGSGVGGGPVGNSGGYSGRPGGSGPSNVPRPGSNRPNDSERANYRPARSGGNGLLAAALAFLLLGRKSNGQRTSGLGNIIRIAVIVFIILTLVRSCTPMTGMDSGYQQFNGGNSNAVVATAAPTARPTPAPTPRPTPAPTPRPTPAPVSSSSLSGTSSYSGSFANNSYFSSGNGSFNAGGSGLDLSSLFGGYPTVNSGSYTSSAWSGSNNSGIENNTVTDGARAKFTTIKGNGNDTVTIMVFMCGTDLESNYSMATKDLQEMANATIGDNVNIIVYTGGCAQWKNNLVKSNTNQIYKIENGGQFRLLNDNVGNKPMVTPSTLSEFIRFCAQNYPANRNMLILWDHGGGSLSGYGYDQKFKSSGSMTLDGIDQALSEGGITFDVIGFDACLMATVETAQVASKYADYLLASEESEPGIGWYYTDWVTLLSRNTSTPTVTLGKRIVDDFVSHCASQCPGQDTTLSLTDLAEFDYTVPPLLNSWADETADMIKTDYRTVAQARGSAKEFAADSRIDQADLTSICYNLNTTESKNLANAIRSAVKYNKTSSTVRNAYGLSIYFPYRSMSSVKRAVNTYNKIGMDSSYSRCVQAYATYASSGQASSYGNGYSSGLGSLLSGLSGYGSGSGYSTGSSNSGYGGSSYSSSYDTSDLIYALLGQMMSGRSLGNMSGMTEEDASFIADTFNAGTLDARSVADYVSANTFDASLLEWSVGEDGIPELILPQDQWDLISELKLSVFRNDGEGFIDLGLDLYEGFFKENGALSGEYDGGWLHINGQEVAYYQMYTIVADDGTRVTLGRVPCLYNGQRANLLIETVNDEPAVVGVCYNYEDDPEILTYAKSVTEYNSTDTVTFIADYYTYDNIYENTYRISDEFTVGEGLEASYMLVADAEEISPCYRFTDFYGQEYWTPVMSKAA